MELSALKAVKASSLPEAFCQVTSAFGRPAKAKAPAPPTRWIPEGLCCRECLQGLPYRLVLTSHTHDYRCPDILNEMLQDTMPGPPVY